MFYSPPGRASPPRGMQRGAPAGPAAADPAAGSPCPPRRDPNPGVPRRRFLPLPPANPGLPASGRLGTNRVTRASSPALSDCPKHHLKGRFGKQLFGNVTEATTKEFPHKLQLCSAETELMGTAFNPQVTPALGKHTPCFVRYLGFVFISIQHHFCTKLTPVSLNEATASALSRYKCHSWPNPLPHFASRLVCGHHFDTVELPRAEPGLHASFVDKRCISENLESHPKNQVYALTETQ